MVATFQWCQSNGAGETITVGIGSINFGSADQANLDPETYPITAGSYSYEVYIFGRFTGTYTKIDNIKFWKSSGNYVTGETIFWTGSVLRSNYAQPVQTKSTVAIGSVPTTEPASANVTIGGSLTGSLYNSGSGTTGSDTDYIVMQTEITTAASPGATNYKQFTLSYDEV